MPGKAHGLFDAIASFPALHAAALRAATGKRRKPGVAAFLANLETEVLRLERALRTGRYRPGRYKTIEVFDPKHRTVSAGRSHGGGRSGALQSDGSTMDSLNPR